MTVLQACYGRNFCLNSTLFFLKIGTKTGTHFLNLVLDATNPKCNLWNLNNLRFASQKISLDIDIICFLIFPPMTLLWPTQGPSVSPPSLFMPARTRRRAHVHSSSRAALSIGSAATPLVLSDCECCSNQMCMNLFQSWQTTRRGKKQQLTKVAYLL